MHSIEKIMRLKIGFIKSKTTQQSSWDKRGIFQIKTTLLKCYKLLLSDITLLPILKCPVKILEA